MKIKKNNQAIRWITLVIVLLILVSWTLWANTALQCNEISIRSERLPASFEGYRIAQISDLHNAEFGSDNEKLIQMLKDAHPDMIVVTGDLIDSSHTDLEIAISFARKAVQIAPTYYVTGNHEAWVDQQYETLERQLEQVGVEVMRNEALYIEQNGERILLIGADDPEFQAGDRIA